MSNNLPANDRVSALIGEFLDEVMPKKPPSARGNLIFGLDATASREETWDIAASLQGQMFHEAGSVGSLNVQLIYYRGAERIDGECKASQWVTNPAQLAAFMSNIKCRAGLTQIGRVLGHALREASQRKIGALVFVGDACEESRDQLITQARLLAELNVPAFMFQEGYDPQAGQTFREIARITKGAHLRFDQGSAKQLGELLRAVAAFAVGGITGLEKQNSNAAKLLLGQIR